MQIMRARAGQRAFALRIITSIMLNCRPPKMAGQAAPKGERRRGPHAGGKAQPAAEPQALGPVVWGEGRRGGVRAEAEGAASSEAAEGIAQVARAAVWPEPPEHCPVCQTATAVARRDACRVASKRRDGRVNSLRR